MRLPSKVTPYRKSTLSKFPVVLSVLREQDMSPIDLFVKVKGRGIDMADFVEILDCLYMLEKIELYPEKEVLHYVERDSM